MKRFNFLCSRSEPEPPYLPILLYRIVNLDENDRNLIDARTQTPCAKILIPEARPVSAIKPITSELADFLIQHINGLRMAPNGQFPISVATGKLMTIGKAHRRVVAAAGLDPVTIIRHIFRHTRPSHTPDSSRR